MIFLILRLLPSCSRTVCTSSLKTPEFAITIKSRVIDCALTIYKLRSNLAPSSRNPFSRISSLVGRSNSMWYLQKMELRMAARDHYFYLYIGSLFVFSHLRCMSASSPNGQRDGSTGQVNNTSAGLLTFSEQYTRLLQYESVKLQQYVLSQSPWPPSALGYLPQHVFFPKL